MSITITVVFMAVLTQILKVIVVDRDESAKSISSVMTVPISVISGSGAANLPMK
jgi:hypothetical protein